MKNTISAVLCLLATACGGQSMTHHGGNVGDDDVAQAGSDSTTLPSTGGSGGSSGKTSTSHAGTGGKSTSSTGGSSVGGSSHAGHSTGGTSSAGQAGQSDSEAGAGGSDDVNVCNQPITDVCTLDPGDSRYCSGSSECACSDGGTPTRSPCIIQDGLAAVRCTCPQATGNGGEGGTNGDDQYKLVIEFNGPSEKTIPMGGPDRVLFSASFTAPVTDVEIDDLPFTLSCSDELTYRGSKGTDYFTNIKVADANTYATIMGPVSLPAAPAMLQDLTFDLHDAFTIKKGETKNIAITIDLADTEDAPGELIGKHCTVTLADEAMILAKDLSVVEYPYLTADDIDPSTPIVGNEMTITEHIGCPNCPCACPLPDPCATFMGVVGSENGGDTRFFATRTILSFNLNTSSPSGAIGDGLQKVITVNARAGCGDAVLTKVQFQTTTDGDDIGWMLGAYQNNVVSAVTYDYGGTYFFDGYGVGSTRSTESSTTGLYWRHEFPQPILIKKDETFTFSLSLTFGGPVVPPGTFVFNMLSSVSWYGTDRPDDYPDVIYSDGVVGNELSYAPSE